MSSKLTHKVLRYVIILLLFLSPLNSGYSALSIPKEKFLEDCSILKLALDELHPGLYRYNNETSFLNAYKELVNFPGDSISLKNAFLSISEFLAKIKCGHTIVNPYNQSETIAVNILNGKNKLPFTFLIVDRKMIIENDLTNLELGRGSEILEINGTPVEKIIDDLLKYSDGDGSNDSQRLNNLSVTGLGSFELSDIYLPLLVPPVDGTFDILYRNRKSRAGFLDKRVIAVTRDERKSMLEKTLGITDESNDEKWKFKQIDKETGLLQIGTFVTYNMELDWKKFLKDVFEKINKQSIQYLIIDIRNNAGGTTEVAGEIVSYITQRPIKMMMEKRLVRYEKVPEALVPYLSTWDNSFMDRSGTVEKFNDRFYSFKNQADIEYEIKPVENPFRGKTFILIDASNSSATFILAKTLKENALATLVGQTTGGNQKGINGGQLVFLNLPSTGIEVDIPLIGYFPDGDPPDAGLEPDVKISESVEDFENGIDAEMNYVLDQIRRSGNGD